jgi:hypothetical protein
MTDKRLTAALEMLLCRGYYDAAMILVNNGINVTDKNILWEVVKHMDHGFFIDRTIASDLNPNPIPDPYSNIVQDDYDKIIQWILHNGHHTNDVLIIVFEKMLITRHENLQKYRTMLFEFGLDIEKSLPLLIRTTINSCSISGLQFLLEYGGSIDPGFDYYIELGSEAKRHHIYHNFIPIVSILSEYRDMTTEQVSEFLERLFYIRTGRISTEDVEHNVIKQFINFIDSKKWTCVLSSTLFDFFSNADGIDNVTFEKLLKNVEINNKTISIIIFKKNHYEKLPLMDKYQIPYQISYPNEHSQSPVGSPDRSPFRSPIATKRRTKITTRHINTTKWHTLSDFEPADV